MSICIAGFGQTKMNAKLIQGFFFILNNIHLISDGCFCIVVYHVKFVRPNLYKHQQLVNIHIKISVALKS